MRAIPHHVLFIYLFIACYGVRIFRKRSVVKKTLQMDRNAEKTQLRLLRKFLMLN